MVMLLPLASATAHAPSVSDQAASSPDEAVLLEDPTLSRAIGAVLGQPGEIDWYRMDLQAGDPLVVGMTAPDAPGAVAATFTLLGPGLPDASLSGTVAEELARRLDVGGAVAFEPVPDPPREVHGGLGFINYGTLRLEAPEDGTFWVAVSAVDAAGTGKYVFAPGVREEFGADAVGGMIDLIDFFNAPWPPVDADHGHTD
jgi:hypothetical protein